MRLLLICLLFTSPVHAEDIRTAIFAGGCFWCVESDFDQVEGVTETVSGFTGGHVENPTYKQVSTSETGHREAVLVKYDAEIVGYETLLAHFWRSIDPFDAGGQFCDRGDSYRSAVYAVNASQQAAAEASKAGIAARFAQPVATEILRTDRFWPAEAYHQDYARKNPLRYSFFRARCGRDRRVKEIWGDAAAGHG